MGFIVKNNNNRKRENEIIKRLTAQNALQSLCCLHADILHIRFFFIFYFLNVSTLAAVSYFSKLTAKNVAELVTQEVSVTMVTFHIPKR